MSSFWIVFINNEEIRMDNLSYLNFLLEKSRNAIRRHDQREMLFLKFDFEEIQEINSLFYTLYKLQIDSEINALNRLTQISVKPFKQKPI